MLNCVLFEDYNTVHKQENAVISNKNSIPNHLRLNMLFRLIILIFSVESELLAIIDIP
jgi:hypothetical protein